MVSVKDIRLRHLIFPLAVFLTMATIGFSDVHIIPNSSLIEPYLWTFGCTPTSAAMVLSHYDNYVPGLGKYVGYGKLIKYYLNAPCSGHNVPNTVRKLKRQMSTDYDINNCSGDGETNPWNIDDGIRAVTNDSLGYSFISENICWAVWPEILTDWCWSEIKSEINANRPFVWSQGNVSGLNIAGHSVAAWGYRDDKYVIVYSTYSTGREDWYYTDYKGKPGDGIASMQVNQVHPDGGSDSDILLDEPIGGEKWIVGETRRIHWWQWGSQIASVNIDVSTDAGNTWVNVESVSSPGEGWKSYDWLVPNTAADYARVRVYAYDSAGELIAADGSFGNFTISPPCSDLIVQSITTNPVTPMVYQDVDVTVTVKNQGSCPALPHPSSWYIVVEFYMNRDSAPSHSDWGEIVDGFGEVPPGGTVTLSGKISYSYDDTFKMWAQVDSGQNVEETDENNNVFGPQSITVVPDNEPPTGSIAINGGAEWTDSLSVTLNLTCADNVGCNKMNFYEEGPGSEWTRTEPFATTKAWTLNGNNYPVYVRFWDKWGNRSQYSDTIRFDAEPPTGSIVINDGATRTKTESVTLTLSCTDYMSRPGAMRLSNDNMTWGQWEALTSEEPTITVSRAWTLSGGEGTKSVYVQYRDNADHISEIYSDTIDFIANLPPVANCASVTVAAGQDCKADASINDGSSDPDNDPVSITQTPNSPYQLGETLVTLTVTDDKGLSDTCQAIVTVVDRTPPAIICPPDVMLVPPVTLDDIGVPLVSDSCDPAPLITSDAPDVFTLGETIVSWTVMDKSGNGSACQQSVIVNNLPVADAGPDQTVIVGETVIFDGSGSSDEDGVIVSYEWDSGDGATDYGEIVEYVYESPGVFTVTLIVTDDYYVTDADTTTVTVLSVVETTENVAVSLQEIIDDNPGTPLADKVEDALSSVEVALDELTKTPPDTQAAVGNIEGAVGDLEAAVNDGLLDPGQGVQLMDQLARLARQLAVDAIDEAIAQGGDLQKITEAEQAVADGDSFVDAGMYKDAVNKYKDALAKGESANPYLD